jgi:hypothetical protein
MEAVANAKNRSLYSPSSAFIENAVEIKDSNELDRGNFHILIDKIRQGFAESMYNRHVIYRRLIDGSYCILTVRNNGESLYYGEV